EVGAGLRRRERGGQSVGGHEPGRGDQLPGGQDRQRRQRTGGRPHARPVREGAGAAGGCGGRRVGRGRTGRGRAGRLRAGRGGPGALCDAHCASTAAVAKSAWTIVPSASATASAPPATSPESASTGEIAS